jgi:hypothetical protein
MTRWIVLIIGSLLMVGCAGTHQTADNPELQMWVGTWQGVAMRENRPDPPRQWTLVLSQKNGRLHGVISDDLGELRRKKVDDLRIVNDQLQFSLSYETARGLQVVCHCRVQLEEDKMLTSFDGREGGRAFEGKWEARRIIVSRQATQ